MRIELLILCPRFDSKTLIPCCIFRFSSVALAIARDFSFYDIYFCARKRLARVAIEVKKVDTDLKQ